jgi:Sugar (and other) transporter
MLITVGEKGYGTYFIFGSFCFAMVAWVWLVLPETKGVSLERMDELFGATSFGDVEDLGRAAELARNGKNGGVLEIERVER